MGDRLLTIWRCGGRPVLAFAVAWLVAGQVLSLLYSVFDRGFGPGAMTVPGMIGLGGIFAVVLLVTTGPVAMAVILVRRWRGWGPGLPVKGAVAVAYLISGLFFASQHNAIGDSLQGWLAGLVAIPAVAAAGLAYNALTTKTRPKAPMNP